MTRYAPLWQQAKQYPASEDRALMAALWPAGGVSGGVVTASKTDMTSSVAPGLAAVPLVTGQGSVLCRWDAAEVPTPNHSPAPGAGTSRVDLICVQVRDSNVDAGANDDFIITTVKGTPAALEAGARDEAPVHTAVAPAVPAHALAIAAVTVPGAAANLSAATVTDMRPPLAGLGWAAGSLAADFATSAAPVTFLTTPSLSVGTWLVNLVASAYNTTTGQAITDIGVGLGTAAGAVLGPAWVESRFDSSPANWGVVIPLTTIAKITSAGTLVFQVACPGSGKPALKALTPSTGAGGATGYTAVKIANV